MELFLLIYDKLEWWQRPLFALLPFLIAALILPKVYSELILPSINALTQQRPKENRKNAWAHLALGIGFCIIGALLTYLSYSIQIDWLGGNSHLVLVGLFIVGVFEVLQGLGILFFRNAQLGVIIGLYAFIGFCAYGLLHWTLAWF